jgi:hypothetical protein
MDLATPLADGALAAGSGTACRRDGLEWLCSPFVSSPAVEKGGRWPVEALLRRMATAA